MARIYRPDSLKAKLCVASASAMVGFWREHGIAHEICGNIIPFRGEYYEVAAVRQRLVRGLIYPVPDPEHTRSVDGSIEAGPNAVLALRREGFRKMDVSVREFAEAVRFAGFWRMAGKFCKIGAGEYYRSFNKVAFVKALQRLVPGIRSRDLAPGGVGVRAQAVDRSGKLVDDSRFAVSDRAVHVVNVPSPAATASIVMAARS